MGLRVSPKALVAAAVSGLALPVLMVSRAYPWQLALPVAIAFGILAYTTLSTVERLRQEGRRREDLFAETDEAHRDEPGEP